ncbi:MAG: sigma-70 family RNA polymerase sigma factor [Saprospiraceae bacterium]|nr:sigma-70 family RNA polymerase sigma factor [Saprospiraceae bacterium]MCB9325811.1 sigma-70 family RNA polymerase sigma factor [Lewinellaceae bacterium]
MKKHEDHQYIEALAKGDRQVLEMIYQQHLAPVKNWVIKNNGTPADAKDIFQESILAIYTKAMDPDFNLTCPLGAFVFHICRNKWISQLRKNKRMEGVIKEEQERYENNWDMAQLIVQVEEEEIRQSKLDKAFSQLSELCQKLLQLVSDGIAAEDISSQLEMAKVSTFYRRKNACIDRWRDLYSNENSGL